MKKEDKTQLVDKLERKLVRMACGKVNDGVKLAFLESGDRDEIDKLDLEVVERFKRGSNGAVEVEFFDRMALFELLMRSCQEDPTQALLRQLGGVSDE